MTIWLRKNGLWALLNISALAIMIVLMTQPQTSPADIGVFDPQFEGSGKWAIRFLLLSLSMTPLNTLFGWRGAIKLRKPAGLWAFGFAALHFMTYVNFRPFDLIWLRDNSAYYIFIGIAALTILSLLAITSHQRAMRLLGKNWKRLHQLVYAAGVLTTLHAIIAYTSGKKYWFNGPDSAAEFYLYLVVLIVLLALRLPIIKQILRPITRRRTPPTPHDYPDKPLPV